jgi:hypothetical protein
MKDMNLSKLSKFAIGSGLFGVKLTQEYVLE